MLEKLSKIIRKKEDSKRFSWNNLFSIKDLVRGNKRVKLPMKMFPIRIKNVLIRKNNKSIMFFTTHKAASMFIVKIAEELSYLGGFHYYSVNRHNLDEKDPNSWKDNNCCYAPLRRLLPSIDPAILGNYNNILHLRDPRDVLVSQFFSLAYSHPCAKGKFNPTDEQRKKWIQRGIDGFIMHEGINKKTRAEWFLLKYEMYCKYLLNKPNVIFVKYENMIVDFKNWLNKIITPFNIHNSEKVVGYLAEKHRNAFKIKRENIMRHRRKIIPGDYKEKLKPETIKELNLMFKDILQKLDYEI